MTGTLWRKWTALAGVYLQEGFAYRAAAIIWVLSDVVPATIMPLVFIAASKMHGQIGGFSSAQFVQYYLTMLLVVNFVISHLMWDLAYEIKDGIFTINLLRPVSYFQVCFIRNFTWRILRVVWFAPIFFVLLILYRGYVGQVESYWGWEAIVSIFLAHFVSFSLVYMLTMFALFMQETRSLFELYYFPMLFLSGELFPIYLMPNWIIAVAKVLPFYYTTALPVDIIMRNVTLEQAHRSMLVQLVYIALHLVGANLLWKRGLRHYSAVGM